jgi:predicted ATP-binding protein involved in virulence
MADDDLKQLLEAMRQENALAHAETRQQVTETRQEMAKSAESLGNSLLETRTGLEHKIEASASETRAMNKFSYRDLDRRVTTLEDTVAELRARVERLESAPH